jgi:hypothetical protein
MALDVAIITSTLDDIIASGAILDAAEHGRDGVLTLAVDALHSYLETTVPAYAAVLHSSDVINNAIPGFEPVDLRAEAKAVGKIILNELMSAAHLWPPIDVILTMLSAIPAELRAVARSAVTTAADWKRVFDEPSLQSLATAVSSTLELGKEVATAAYGYATDAVYAAGRLARTVVLITSQALSSFVTLALSVGRSAADLLMGLTAGTANLLDALTPGGKTGPLSEEGILGVPGVPII